MAGVEVNMLNTVETRAMDADTKISTNLCLIDKHSFFTSILTSLTDSVTLQSCYLTDLVLLCAGPDGLLPVSVHSAVLSSQSPILRHLLLSATEPVLVLPEVELNTVWCMLDLLYTGRCLVTKLKDSFKLIHLLTSLGLDNVASAIEMEKLIGEHIDPQEYLDQSMSERMSSSGSIKCKLSPPSPDLDCKECGVKFHAKQAVKFFFHERDCKMNSAKRMLMPRNAENNIKKEVSVPLSPSTDSPNTTTHSDDDYTGHFCQMCGGKSRNLYKLRDHYTSKHFFNEVKALVIDRNSHSCQICGKVFEGGSMIYHMIRHIGATHEKVLPFVERECGTTILSCEQCQICNEKIDSDVSFLGQHLTEEHFKTNITNLLLPNQSECHICDAKVKSIDDLVLHVANTHGQAMKLYRECLGVKTPIAIFRNPQDECFADRNLTTCTQKPKKICKICHICGSVIAGAGRGWRFPLFAHFSRRHFAEELVRDFRTEDKKCSLCGKEEESYSGFLIHVGAKHRQVERYLDLNHLQEYETSNGSPPSLVKTRKRKQTKPRRLQLEVTGLARKLMDEADHESSLEMSLMKPKSPQLKRRKNNIAKRKPGASISCPYCEKKVVMRPVLQSHLLSRHFKKDCEEGIKQIFEKTGGVCPECPGFKWSKPLDWKVFIHFSRKHKIAEDLEYSNNLPNKDNVKKILERFCP